MQIVGVVQDVLLSILYYLEVTDLLRLETTCRQLRAFISSARHLWLAKLNELDPARAPLLPPHTDVDRIPSSQLRELVVNAVRRYYNMTNGHSPTTTYVLDCNIFPQRPERILADHTCSIRGVKLSPDGRFFFMCWTFHLFADASSLERDEEFGLYERVSGRRLWYLNLVDPESNSRVSIIDYTFDVCRDGSFTLAMIVRKEAAHSNVGIRTSQIFRLSQCRDNGLYEGSIVYSSEGRDATCFVVWCDVSANLVVFGDFDVAHVVNWRENLKFTMRYPHRGSLTHFRVWNNYLFYFDHDTPALCALSLVQTMASLHPTLAEEFDLQELDTSDLRLDAVKDQYGKPPILGGPRGTSYSIFDRPWKTGPKKGTFMIMSRSVTYSAHVVVTRVVFDPSESKSSRWTVLSVRQSRGADTNIRISARSELSRSGRLLTAIWRSGAGFRGHARNGFPTAGLIAVDKDGTAIFPKLTKTVNGSLEQDLAEANADFNCDSIEQYLGEYNDALVILKDKQTGRDSIEIYHHQV